MEQKPIQAVEMVRGIRNAIYEETKDLSREELKAYFAREAATLRREITESKLERCPDRPAARRTPSRERNSRSRACSAGTS